MTSREMTIETIRRAYEARDTGNIEALMGMFHAEATFEFVGDRTKVQIAGVTAGHSNIRGTMSDFISTFEFQEREFVNTVIEGDRAAIHSRVKVRFVPENTVFQTQVLDIIRFQSGKIIQLVEFADTALLRSILGD